MEKYVKILLQITCFQHQALEVFWGLEQIVMALTFVHYQQQKLTWQLERCVFPE